MQLALFFLHQSAGILAALLVLKGRVKAGYVLLALTIVSAGVWAYLSR